MANAFSITTVSGTVELDANRQGSASFSVSNVSGQPIRARADVVAEAVAAQAVAPEPVGAGAREAPRESHQAPAAPPPPPADSWFTIEGAAERSFQVGGTEVYRVDVAVPAAAAPPPDAAPRQYRFRLDVLGTDNPDEEQAQGQWVEFTVNPQAAPPRRIPWLWIIVAAAAVVVIAAGIVTAVILTHRQGTLTPSANTVNFGTVRVGQPATQQITVKNTGAVGTTVNAKISGANAADFSVATSACLGHTLNPNATCVFNVTFTPPATGSDVGSLEITGNHAAASTVALTGTGGAPIAVASPTPLTLVPLKQGDFLFLRGTVTITNSGNTPLHVTSTSMTSSGSAFLPAVSNGCTGQTVAPNQHCSITVSILAGFGTPTGTLTVSSDATDNPLVIQFS